MPNLKSVLVVQYFIKTIISSLIIGLLTIAIIQSGVIDFLLEISWMKPAIILTLIVIPVLFAIDEYESNRKMIKILLK